MVLFHELPVEIFWQILEFGVTTPFEIYFQYQLLNKDCYQMIKHFEQDLFDRLFMLSNKNYKPSKSENSKFGYLYASYLQFTLPLDLIQFSPSFECQIKNIFIYVDFSSLFSQYLLLSKQSLSKNELMKQLFYTIQPIIHFSVYFEIKSRQVFYTGEIYPPKESQLSFESNSQQFPFIFQPKSTTVLNNSLEMTSAGYIDFESSISTIREQLWKLDPLERISLCFLKRGFKKVECCNSHNTKLFQRLCYFIKYPKSLLKTLIFNFLSHPEECK